MLTKNNLDQMVKNSFLNSNILNNCQHIKQKKPTYINKANTSVLEISNNGCSYLILPVDQDINLIEKAFNQIILTGFENAIVNKGTFTCLSNKNIKINPIKIANNNKSVEFNLYYKDFKRIELFNNLVILYEIKEVRKIDSTLVIDEVVLGLEDNNMVDNLSDNQEFNDMGIESYTLEISVIYEVK